MHTLNIVAIEDRLGFLLPEALMQEMGWKQGDVLCATRARDGFRLTPYSDVFAQQMAGVESVMAEHADVFRELAQR